MSQKMDGRGGPVAAPQFRAMTRRVGASNWSSLK
jgi:hypothetical protein